MNGANDDLQADKRFASLANEHGADAVGAVCSVACGLHCLAIPFMLAVTPATELLRWFHDPMIHQVAAVLSAIIVYWALWPNWSKYRDKTVATTALAGVTLVSIAAFGLPESCCMQPEGAERTQYGDLTSPLRALITPLGGSMILMAHLFNMQLTRRSCHAANS